MQPERHTFLFFSRGHSKQTERQIDYLSSKETVAGVSHKESPLKLFDVKCSLTVYTVVQLIIVTE